MHFRPYPLIARVAEIQWTMQVPMDEKMVDWTLLSPDETQWLQQHNKDCAQVLLAHIPKSDKETRKYLRQYMRKLR